MCSPPQPGSFPLLPGMDQELTPNFPRFPNPANKPGGGFRPRGCCSPRPPCPAADIEFQPRFRSLWAMRCDAVPAVPSSGLTQSPAGGFSRRGIASGTVCNSLWECDGQCSVLALVLPIHPSPVSSLQEFTPGVVTAGKFMFLCDFTLLPSLWWEKPRTGCTQKAPRTHL